MFRALSYLLVVLIGTLNMFSIDDHGDSIVTRFREGRLVLSCLIRELLVGFLVELLLVSGMCSGEDARFFCFKLGLSPVSKCRLSKKLKALTSSFAPFESGLFLSQCGAKVIVTGRHFGLFEKAA